MLNDTLTAGNNNVHEVYCLILIKVENKTVRRNRPNSAAILHHRHFRVHGLIVLQVDG